MPLMLDQRLPDAPHSTCGFRRAVKPNMICRSLTNVASWRLGAERMDLLLRQSSSKVERLPVTTAGVKGLTARTPNCASSGPFSFARRAALAERSFLYL